LEDTVKENPFTDPLAAPRLDGPAAEALVPLHILMKGLYKVEPASVTMIGGKNGTPAEGMLVSYGTGKHGGSTYSVMVTVTDDEKHLKTAVVMKAVGYIDEEDFQKVEQTIARVRAKKDE
jgi:hypothetical protein